MPKEIKSPPLLAIAFVILASSPGRSGTVTVTRVTQGSVLVRDFKRKRNVVVRAGKSYLARR